LDHVPDGVVVLRESQFIYANPAAARILGYASPEELLGVHYSAIVRPEELPHSVERVKKMAAGELPPRHERPMVRRDGSTVYAETLGFATDFDGAPATVVIAHDLTSEKLMHDKIRQADRLVSLGLLAAGVAHELNNPLAYVLLNLAQVRRWLKESLVNPSANRLQSALELIEQSLEGTERMRLILGDLRAFSRQDDRPSSHLDVCAVLDAVIPMTEHLIRGRATLVRDYAPVPLVRANEGRLGQVFVNLLANAAQAIPEGSERAHEVRITVRADGASNVVIQVSDTGTGMSRAVLERAFEPFFTTKPADSGTGLGLSVCLGIVQGLGGTLTAESDVGRGSTFTVTLPTSEPTTVSAPVPRSSRARVLVVDDEPIIARRLADILVEHDVVVVTSGREAITRLREERFDVVFCDLMMSDVTGMQVFEDLTGRDPTLASRFIFMTAGAYTPSARAFLDRVPNPRLDKPFYEDQVRRLLELVMS
jgi:PAS domain S-box-containing protein